jgi:DNA-binding NarL/FixJ family response regulator
MGPQSHVQKTAAITIATAEDEALVSLMLADVLESAGAVVVGPASTVKAALDLLGEEAIDCAVLDVKLEDGISVPVAEALAALGIRFVIATGSDTVPAGTTALRSFIKSSCLKR